MKKDIESLGVALNIHAGNREHLEDTHESTQDRDRARSLSPFGTASEELKKELHTKLR